MPLTFVIDEKDQIVVTTAVGEEVTAADLLEHAHALVAVANRPRRELVDFQEPRELQVTLAAVREIAAYLHDADANPSGSRLVLVGATDVIFGTLRVFAAHREHPNVAIQVFRESVEARRWLLGSAS